MTTKPEGPPQEPQSRSVQRRIAAQKGKPMPTFIPATAAPSQPVSALEILHRHVLPRQGEEGAYLAAMREFAAQQSAASELKGWQDAINSVRASLQQYPAGGGDTVIMTEVERIVATKGRTAMSDDYDDRHNVPGHPIKPAATESGAHTVRTILNTANSKPTPPPSESGEWKEHQDGS